MIREEEKKEVLLPFEQKKKNGEREETRCCLRVIRQPVSRNNFILLLDFPLMYSNKDMIYFIFIVN